MAIQVNYGPSLETIGTLAALGGVAQSAREQEARDQALNMERARLAEQQRQFNVEATQRAVFEVQRQAEQRRQFNASMADRQISRQQEQEQRLGELVSQEQRQREQNKAVSIARDRDHISRIWNDLNPDQQSEVMNQFYRAHGTDVPNPIAVDTATKETESPELRLSNARDSITSDPQFQPGFEKFIQLNRDGQVDFTAYNKRLEIEAASRKERERAMVSSYDRRFNALADEEKTLDQLYEKDANGDVFSFEEYAKQKARFATRRRALQAEMDSSLSGEPAAESISPLEEGFAAAEQQRAGQTAATANANGLPVVRDADDVAAIKEQARREGRRIRVFDATSGRIGWVNP